MRVRPKSACICIIHAIEPSALQKTDCRQETTDWTLDTDMGMNLEWLCGLARKIIISQVIIGFAIQMRTQTQIQTRTQAQTQTQTQT